MAEEHRLHYAEPSTDFTTSLPLANGRLAASVMSSPSHESLVLNEITFWSGALHVAGSGLVPGSGDPKVELRKTQQCFLDGDFAQGEERSERYLESKKLNFGTNLAVGKLEIAVKGHSDDVHVSGFKRDLQLDRALAQSTYSRQGHSFRRRCFVSHPHELLVVNFETDDPNTLELDICVRGENDAFKSSTANGLLSFDSQALEKVHSDGKCGVRGYGIVAAQAHDGTVMAEDGRLVVTGKKSITILLAFNTSYQQDTDAWKDRAARQIKDALLLSVADLLTAHLADYQPLYQRASLSLGDISTPATDLPTNERRQRLEASPYGDPGMFALYFHYARYLTIAGNRASSPLPLHLQGIWNDGEACRMGWSCDYHLDINTQMNYYPTLGSALGDLMKPLVSYLNDLAKAGQDAARTVYGCHGWVAHVFSNVWGFADPGWEVAYGLNVTGGLWMASHLIEMYEYSKDDAFLEETAYPILKGAAEFFLDYVVEDPKTGWLLTGPAVSPENSFFISNKGGQQDEHYAGLAPTLDVVLLKDLFAFCTHATERLGIDSAFAQRVAAANSKLPPFQIGKHGQLQEWLCDYDEAQPYHRHLSHTMALCRSALISERRTPDLAKAVAVTLDRRQGRDDLEDIEFTAALFAQNYARLGNADKALGQVGHLVSGLSFDNLLSYSKPGVAGAEENIFVIDGNFGGAAAIMEMLVRSIMPTLSGPVEVDLLPALPASWPEGKVKGLRVRGNIELDMEWSDGKLDNAVFKPFSCGSIEVYYGGKCLKKKYEAEERFELGSSLEKCK